MPQVGISPVWIEAQYFDNDGKPLAYGKIYTYQDGSDSNKETYTDISGGVANNNPIRLDSSGRLQTSIWLTAGEFYSFKLADVYDNELARVNTVSTPLYTAGDNVQLSSQTGPNIVITAVPGLIGSPKGRGQSYVFTGLNTDGEYVSGNGDLFSYITLTSLTEPIGDPDVDYYYDEGGQVLFDFLTTGIYIVDITTSFVTRGEDYWPGGESISGINFGNDTPISTTYHTRYRSTSYYGGDSFVQLSFTDTLSVKINSAGQRSFGVFIQTEDSYDQQFETSFTIVITKIGDIGA